MAKQKEIARWAEQKGFDFRPETDGLDTEDARKLDSFRNWDSAEHHIVGENRNRPFEMLDITKYFRSGRGDGANYTTQTVLLLPNAASTIPDFEIVPRNIGVTLDFFGAGGLKLAKDDAHRATREMVDRFSKHYMIFAGGIRETGLSERDKEDANELDLEAIATICKPNVLQFLTRNPDWYIESQAGHLVIWSPGRVLSGDERIALLRTASELLDRLAAAKNEQSVTGIELESTYDLTPAKLARILGGGAAGFFLGAIAAMVLAFTIHPKLILTIPIFAFCGLALGVLVGKKLSS